MEQNKSDTRTRADKETNSLFLRKEIFDHAIIYTTNKIEEGALLIYLKNLYEHFKKLKKEREHGGSVNHDDQMYVTLDSWLGYNEVIKGQDHICSSNFTHNVCKSLWILLSITLQSVKKKNNVNGQRTIFNASLNELNRECEGKKDREEKDTPQDVWNENWVEEQVSIELLTFFIILQFLKIDNVKRKYDKNLSEDSWPHFCNSPRSLSNSSSALSANGIVSSMNGSSGPGTCTPKSNLSDFFHFCGNNYKHFLKTYLIAFLCATDIINSSSLTHIPLYFRSEHLFLLDFIVDTNDHTNVYERYLQKNEPKILYKTKDILNWLLTNLCMPDCASDDMVKGVSNNGQSHPPTTHSCASKNPSATHYGIENINNDIYTITNVQGKTIYITSDKNIINISNCKECNIFIFSKVEYLKIHLCVNCCIISLAVEMIATFFNSQNLDVHLVTRSLKIENVIDTNVYVYTETNIIIFGDTRNIQLAPYNILNKNQRRCLRKSRISFSSKNCDLFAFPLKCKISLFHSVSTSHGMNLTHSASLSGGANFPLSRRTDKSGKSATSGVGAAIGEADMGATTYSDTTSNHVNATEEKNEGVYAKPFDMTNLNSSFTDYVYYLLSPSKFFLTEFPTPNFASDGAGRALCGQHHEEDCANNVNNRHYNPDGKEVPPAEGTYKTEESQTYECLYLPEVYKNAIESQDDHILQFLSFMESIHLSGAQMQKVKKILTYKLYAYSKTSKKAFRVLSDFVSQGQDAPGSS
ncbi:hypothetical protein AK88_02060 [Plasmodium fragile]|uniref:C-CAP/cofactor C-like domain-containing protein n=1 Tax=Plasmodium fragile TaxID=5857 RepID=A0A0D9QMM0_PLAFR|nr:uncharacterized protein AK88_02060 [Plasmodium fragile]KJP88279.1 hypothetical protein AK88_02060 [Plasmodium fragile]